MDARPLELEIQDAAGQEGAPRAKGGATAQAESDASLWTSRHTINIRLSIPFFFGRYYLTVVAGKERRSPRPSSGRTPQAPAFDLRQPGFPFCLGHRRRSRAPRPHAVPERLAVTGARHGGHGLMRQSSEPARSSQLGQIARLWRREDGIAALEFAFLLPVFLLLLTGVAAVRRDLLPAEQYGLDRPGYLAPGWRWER